MRVGRREALDTFRYALNAAGRTVRVQASETGVVNRAVARARRSMLVDVVLTDISRYCEITICDADSFRYSGGKLFIETQEALERGL